jgi:hypothetical protein
MLRMQDRECNALMLRRLCTHDSMSHDFKFDIAVTGTRAFAGT